MLHTRRRFLAVAAAMVGTMPLALSATAATTSAVNKPATPEEILSLFQSLPGETSIKIHAPAINGKPEFLVASRNTSKRMFVGSAIKTFILCESLRQVDSPDLVKTLTANQLTLDASVWSVGSPTFNPPNLIGKVSQRTALEAMIQHSDNTATDMSIKHAGPDNVRKFIASAGLKNTMIPESTRTFFGYILGAKDYKNFTWGELEADDNQPTVNPPMNTVETLASSADDLVSYYERALQGEFFKNKATLNEFRRILSMGDAIWALPVPLGVSAFMKGGSIDVKGFHAVCASGAMFFDDRWVYFCLTTNWDAKAATDPDAVKAFLAAGSRALTRVKETLSA